MNMNIKKGLGLIVVLYFTCQVFSSIKKRFFSYKKKKIDDGSDWFMVP